jgi:thiol:disulfide interchange protein
MKSLLAPAVAALALLGAVALGAEPEYPKMGDDIFDVHADGDAQVSAALARAAAEHKRVLLDFGANWCIWCHRLHNTLETDPAVSRALQRDYVVVMVDVNTRKGTKRNTKDTGELEDGEGHSPAKIVAFLSAWAPPGH